ncbi:MAG: hypothetical protein RLY16_1410 [Bacteroidota bacterium]
MEINCVIIEDEPLAQERLKTYVSKLPYLKLLACFEQIQAAHAFLLSNVVDLILLDIQLKDRSGIEWLETASPNCQVVITTAYPQHALKGFDLKVADYLLKPFTFERFNQAMERVVDNFSNRLMNNVNFILVKTEHRVERVLIQDILFIEGMRDYRKIHATKGNLMTLVTFTNFEQELALTPIYRVHKSFMVAINKIDRIEKGMIFIGEKKIPISGTYKKSFFQKLDIKSKFSSGNSFL